MIISKKGSSLTGGDIVKLINLHDRFGRRLVAGVTASLVLYGLNMLSYYVFHFSNRRYINWAALLIFGEKENSTAEFIIMVCRFWQLVWDNGIELYDWN